MKHEMTTCPVCGKALARCTDNNLIKETRKAINEGYGWSWFGEECQDCWQKGASRELTK